jgi:hypothetical protein
MISFVVGQNAAPGSNSPFTINIMPVLNIKIDVNTATTFGVVIGDQLRSVIEEMGEEVLSIVESNAQVLLS